MLSVAGLGVQAGVRIILCIFNKRDMIRHNNFLVSRIVLGKTKRILEIKKGA